MFSIIHPHQASIPPNWCIWSLVDSAIFLSFATSRKICILFISRLSCPIIDLLVDLRFFPSSLSLSLFSFRYELPRVLVAGDCGCCLRRNHEIFSTRVWKWWIVTFKHWRSTRWRQGYSLSIFKLKLVVETLFNRVNNLGVLGFDTSLLPLVASFDNM